MAEFTQVRHLAYLARVLMTKRYRYRDGVSFTKIHESCVFAAKHPKLFRRAFVEASLAPPFEIRHGEGRACTFHVGSDVVAQLGPHGGLLWSNRRISPISLAPKNVTLLTQLGLRAFWGRLLSRYEQLLDLPQGCISGGQRGIDGSYYHPEVQQALDCAMTYEERQRVRDANPPLLQIESVAGGYAFSKHRRIRGLAIQAIKTFCAALTDEQRKALRRAHVLDTYHADLVERVTSRETGAWWLQALEAYPALMRWACSDRVPPGIAAAIDGGMPLIPALASHFELSEAAVRRFRGVMPQRVGKLPDRDYCPETESLRFVADLPQHLRPQSRADYRAAFRLYTILTPRTMRNTAERIEYGPRGSIDVPALTRGMKRPLSCEPRIDALTGFVDVFGSMNESFGLIRACELIRSQSLGRLVELNAAWHRAQLQATRQAAKQAAAVPESHWPGLLPEGGVELGRGVVAVDLTSMQALLKEGAALDHCVGGYYGLCYDGISRIVSLRSHDGVPRSTIEFQLKRTSPRAKARIVIAQHYAAKNSQPSPDDQAAAASLLTRLQSDADLAWPRLARPESLEALTHRLVEDRLAEFFHAWFGLCQDDAALNR